jgi:hypothetical protein
LTWEGGDGFAWKQELYEIIASFTDIIVPAD